MQDKFEMLEFFPVIALKLTKSCRMHCKFCCEHNSPNTSLPLDDIMKILTILKDNNVRRLCYSGGEPLLVSYIGELLKNAHEMNFENILLTADGKKLEELDIPGEYVDKLRISLHGMEKTHDEITGVNGSFKDLENAVKKVNSKYNLSLTCVLTPENKNEAEDIVKWAIANNIKAVYFANLLKSGLGSDYINKSGKITADEFQDIVSNLIEKYEDKVDIKTHPFELNAQCIIIYCNGDMFIDPFFDGDSENYQKFIGNIFTKGAKEIFIDFKKDKLLWDDYCNRLNKSTIYEK